MRPIIVFTPLLEEEFSATRKAKLTPTLGTEESIREWSLGGSASDSAASAAGAVSSQREALAQQKRGPSRAESPKLHSRAPYHLAIDTGMSRAGVQWRDVPKLIDVIKEFPPEGAFTHFHSAELENGTLELEDKLFREAIALLPERPKILHADNSAAIVHRKPGKSEGWSWDAIRPGVFLYGVGSGPTAALQPEPLVHVRARVVEIRTIEPGDTVSYDAIYTAPSRRRVATAAVGYGDGYPRALSGKERGIVRGRSVPLLGRVTMDMTMFDVTDVPCEVGDVVTLLGRDGEELITVEEVGATADMSPYEILTGLSIRLDRVYHQ